MSPQTASGRAWGDRPLAAPTSAPQEALTATSAEGLVDALLVLTHRIHEARDGGRDAEATELRAQRGMVRVELLRRVRTLRAVR